MSSTGPAHAPGAPRAPRLILATSLGEASGGIAVAAALGVALARTWDGALLVELGATRARGPTMLASATARVLEESLRGAGFEWVAARGRLCWLGLPEVAEDTGLGELERALEAAAGTAIALRAAGPAPLPRPAAVAHLPARLWRPALVEPSLRPVGALLRADLPDERALTAMAVIELCERRVPVRVASRSLGRVAARRALAGLEPGGASGSRIGRIAGALTRRAAVGSAERGQALLITLGAAFAIAVVAAVLVALGGAVTGAARTQRAADLAALSGARSLRDDFRRLFTPARTSDGTLNRAHLDKRAYLERAAAAAREAATRNGVDPSRVRIAFPDADSFAPVRVKVRLAAERPVRAEAEAAPALGAEQPAMASGGGYSGPLAYRQGKPMRPDVAAAFDRMAAAARRAGISLVINSAYRSDAEQARLFAAHPDPRWVAPPGHSLHRCATELDLGPPSAYGWLNANARRFGFLKRYPWEPWHFGYTRGPPPCSAAANASGGGQLVADGRDAGAGGLPAFVPPRFREPIEHAAARWNVSAGLLAAQLMAESNFNPYAVSGAGAQGIAQFMPGTAAAYGLGDPFDARAAIDAQAHLMSDLLRQFGSVPLALAAYNAGPAPVAACHCVPDIPETQAYVARILGLMGGAGELAAPTLEVRLVD
jgi:Transglycosylase SLT domain/D-alanyl-D-alanine carboxypeptidase